MQTEQLQNLLNAFSDICQLPIHLFIQDRWVFTSGLSESGSLENPFICDGSLFEAISAGSSGSLYICPEKKISEIYYGIIRASGSAVCVFGPVSRVPLSSEQIHEYIRFHKMKDFFNFPIPCVPIQKAVSLLSLLSLTILGKSQKPEIPIFDLKPCPPVNDYEITRHLLSNTNNGIMRVPYQLQQQFGEYVKNADWEGLNRLSQNQSIFSISEMSHLPIKQAEYTAVLAISFIRQSAISGGLEPVTAYSKSDLYMQKVSSANTVEGYFSILDTALKDYINSLKLVQQQKSNSFYIQKCKQYIKTHLTQPIGLLDVAEYVGLTPTYTSKLFSKCEHMTFKQYLLKERIQTATYMLKYSEDSIGLISNYLCFCSQSHFSEVFKKYTGLSPSLYRENHAISL